MVEDDPLNQKLMEYYLKESYDIVYATNVRDAVDSIQKQEPDVILLDILLRGRENGLEICRFVRSSGKYNALPVIAVTSLTTKEDERMCMKLGCNDFLPKPVRQDSVLTAIRNQFS